MTENQLNSVTSLGRPIDPKYPTNLAILIATPVAALAGVAVSLAVGNGLGTALGDAFYAAFSVLMAWIIGREVDPEHDLSAFVGSALAFLAVIALPENPNLLAVFLLDPLTRIVNRTVGPPATRLDLFIILGGSLLFVLFGRWQLGIVAVVALLMDAFLYPRHPSSAVFAAGVMGGWVIYVVAIGIDPFGDLTLPYIVVALAIAVFFIGTILSVRVDKVRSDVTNQPLQKNRVRGAMILVLLTGLLLFAHGDKGIQAVSPLWATMLGVSLYYVFLRVRDRFISPAR